VSINYKQLKGKVEDCLEKDEKSRNSDIRLYNMLIVSFPIYRTYVRIDGDGDFSVKLKDKYNLPKEEDVCRIRRKLNSEGKYLPTDPEVIKQRKLAEKEWHEEMSDSVSNPSLF